VEERVEHEAPSGTPAVSGERDAAEQSDDLEEDAVSVHVRRTTPPPMSPEEYRQTLAMTVPPHSTPRIEETLHPPGVTTPPSAHRSESLAKMSAFSPDSATEYSLDVPLAPPLPALSIPAASDFPQSIAASTERPTKLGATIDLLDRTRVLRVAISKARIAELALDHRAGFVLSLVDGRASIEEVLDMCPMPEPEALALLHELLQRGVVAVDVGRYGGRASS
jgi:hypothetical protein